MHGDIEVKADDTKPMVSKGEIDHVYNQNKFNMITELKDLYERVINGETLRSIKIVA